MTKTNDFLKHGYCHSCREVVDWEFLAEGTFTHEEGFSTYATRIIQIRCPVCGKVYKVEKRYAMEELEMEVTPMKSH